jgi:hypothetical protein
MNNSHDREHQYKYTGVIYHTCGEMEYFPTTAREYDAPKADEKLNKGGGSKL